MDGHRDADAAGVNQGPTAARICCIRRSLALALAKAPSMVSIARSINQIQTNRQRRPKAQIIKEDKIN